MPPKRMPIQEPIPLPTVLPELPVPVADFAQYVAQNPTVPVRQLLQPFLDYETVLRSYFAQEPDHEFVQGNHVNLISLFNGGNADLLKIRARNLAEESKEEMEKYIMSLADGERKANGDRILVESMKEFQDNFNIFTEGSLANLDWNNVVAAGSSVLTPLLKVPAQHGENRKALREYYHQQLAPASDIDLFIYGIEDPQEAIEKLAAIEATVKNNLLWETTSIRTRNTVTIVSQYPNRHVQIVLRLYKSPAQILTGFDVNCSCFAYDGTNVLANPRAVAACMTQCNDIDLTRRSPSYENRLSKYSHRGFEVYCEFLDRSRIDPTIFERSFTRTTGLARLLILEALPKPEDRDHYVIRRRNEMGRPQKPIYRASVDPKNIKTRVNDEVAEWDFEDISGYQKFSIPYGPDYNAKRLEKLFFKKDLLLNAEWNPANKPPNRTVGLHRHPVFFGTVKDVVEDCCGFCPEPLNEEERKVFEEEEKIYVSGVIKFLSDDPGRQEIGSFYPLSPEDYTDMAYVGPTGMLCEAIVDNDVNYVKAWCAKEDVDLNCRDFCGRTPLQLACMSTSTEMEIVQTLIDAGARLVARLQDGRTALHLAAARGRADMVRALLTKSAANAHERDEKIEKRAAAENSNKKEESEAAATLQVEEKKDEEMEDVAEDATMEASEKDSQESYDRMSDAESENAPTTTTQSFVKVKKSEAVEPEVLEDTEEDDDIYDTNVIDWDNGMSPLHHAIIGGHEDVVEALISGFGADVTLPMKIFSSSYYDNGEKKPTDAILNLVLALKLKDKDKRASMAERLLKLGASSAQANSFHKFSAFHYTVMEGCIEVLDKMFEHDGPGAMSVMENIGDGRYTSWSSDRPNATPLVTALMISRGLVDYLLDHGARGKTSIESFMEFFSDYERTHFSSQKQQYCFGNNVKQPIEVALVYELTCNIFSRLIAAGADPSTITSSTYSCYSDDLPLRGETILDMLRGKIEKCEKFLNTEEKEPAEFKEKIIYGPEVLEQYGEDTYERFYAEEHWRNSNRAAENHNKCNQKPDKKEVIAKQNKKAAVEELLTSLKETEKTLVAAGGKTYFELFPEKYQMFLKEEFEARIRNTTPQYTLPTIENQEADKDESFKVIHSVNAPYLGESKASDVQEGYKRLFEAIWRGTPEDAALVKELTLGSTGEGDNKIPALKISVANDLGWTTLWIALYRKNWEMAKLILAIVEQQYAPAAEDTTLKRFNLNIGSEGDAEIIENTIEAAFTVENIGVRKDLVKSDVSPYSFLFRAMSPERLLGLDLYSELCSKGVFNSLRIKSWTPLSYAIFKNDFELLRFVLSLAAETKEDGINDFINVENDFKGYGNASHIRLALALGRTEVLEEFMKTVCFGIPFTELEEADEEFQAQKPKYYQGLTVYGTKRKDWAASSYPGYESQDKNVQKAIQIAVVHGQLDSIKWLLSERPFECLKRFMEAYPDTHKAKLLKKQGDGLGFLLQKGLGVETTLLPHLAVKLWFKEYPMETLRFLLSRPGALEARTNMLLNMPLYAVSKAAYNKDALTIVEELLKPEYEANFLVRDIKGRNILHLALVPIGQRYSPSWPDIECLKQIFKMLPEEVHETGWTQKMLGTNQTPLAHWLVSNNGTVDITKLRLILKHSKGRELGIANGEGNLPLHWAFQNGFDGVAAIFLTMAPQYLHYENANGRTPMEIATSRYLLNITSSPPQPPSRVYHGSVLEKSLSEFYPPEKKEIDQLAIRDNGGDRLEGEPEESADKMDVDKEKEEEKPKDSVIWDTDWSDIEGTYQFAVKSVERLPGKRKLVSLIEANELAKRITAGTNIQSDQEFNGGDILSLWD